jgi:uncharacterized lipoprotein YddW (UPF0748 family)
MDSERGAVVPISGLPPRAAVSLRVATRHRRPVLRAALAILLAVLCTAGVRPQAARDTRPVYAIWAPSDYQPWPATIYAQDPGYVLRELDWMQDVGINTYLPLALASGRVNWPSARFPNTRDLYGALSPVDLTVRGGTQRGIASQLYMLMGFVGSLEDPWAAPDLRAHPEWDVVGANGQGTLTGEAGTAWPWGTFLWWDLGHPAVQERILGMVAEAVARYPTVQGVHLDYIRSPGLGGCFSDACLARFQAATGVALPAHLPSAAARARYIHAEHEETYVAWRADEITGLVRRIRALLRTQRPGMTLAADVFAHAEGAYRGVSQDWRRWVAEGLVDAVYPMYYGDAQRLWDVGDYVRDTVATLDQRAVAAGQRRAAVVVGLSTAGYEPLAPEDAAALISRALASGADGVALEMLPYWWHAQYQQFRQHYRPQSDGWHPLWDYDAMLRRVFRGE